MNNSFPAKYIAAIIFVFSFSFNALGQGNVPPHDQAKAKVLIAQGEQHFAAKEWSKAAKALEQAAKVDLTNASIFYTLGKAYYNNGQFTKSRDAFRKVLKLDTNYQNAKQNLADAENMIAKEKAERKAASENQLNGGNTQNRQTATNTKDTPKAETVSSGKTNQPSRTTYVVGDRVNVLSTFAGIPYEATILEINEGKYKVHYEYTSDPDEWATADRVVPFDAGDTKSGPPAGNYNCWMPAFSNIDYNTKVGNQNGYMGSLIVKANGVYEYTTSNKVKSSGSFTYNPKTRVIVWKSGPFAKPETTGEYINRANNGPVIVIVFPKGKKAGYYQNCLKKN